MADEPQVVTRYYPNLALGPLSIAPPRSLDPENGSEYVWRDANNFLARNGRLQKRGGFTALASQPTAATPTGGALMKGEIPLIILTDTLGASDFIVLITSMQILVYPNATTGWVAATPRYATGTVTATNGSAAIVGAGTAFLSRFMTPGQYMLLDATWYKIAAVNNDLSITLASNYTGATGAGKSFIITRNWQLHTDVSGAGIFQLNPSNPDIWAEIFNGDLYVAGTYIGGADGTTKCAVLKVADIYGAASPTTYLTGNNAYVVGLDTISGLTRIAGLKCLQDGRVVIGGNTNTAYYSSHLNTAVWTTSPGGQVPISMGNGRITTLGMIGNIVTAHYQNGIVLGTPTGSSDPPLRWQKSTATKGCDTHRTLKSIGALEIFMTSDNDICTFDGGETKSLGNGEIRYRFMNTVNSSQDFLFASVDPERMEYMLWQGGTPATISWLYQFESDTWWPMSWPMPVWAAFGANHPVAGMNSARTLCGFSTLNYGTGAIFSNLLFQLDESLTSDTVAYPQGVAQTVTCHLTTDDLDFGDPLHHKTAQYVVIWLTPRVTSSTNTSPESFRVAVSRDAGVTYTTISSSLIFASNLAFAIPVQACFDPNDPGAGHTLRFKFSFGLVSPFTITPSPERLYIKALRGAEIQLVEL